LLIVLKVEEIPDGELHPIVEFGHKLSAIMSGRRDNVVSYYCCPTQPGCNLWILLEESNELKKIESKYPKGSPLLLNKIRVSLMSLLHGNGSMIPKNCCLAFTSCLNQYGFEYSQEPYSGKDKQANDNWKDIKAITKNNDNSSLVCSFDESNRLRGFQFNLE